MGEYVNSKQSRFNVSYVSCGVVEVHHLPDESPAQTLFAIGNNLYHKANGRPAAFVVFSDVVDRKESRGASLAELVKTMRIGDLFESAKVVNPKTGNTIRLWVLTINHDSFRKWYAEEFVNRISES
jgi:hypothetical protein